MRTSTQVKNELAQQYYGKSFDELDQYYQQRIVMYLLGSVPHLT